MDIELNMGGLLSVTNGIYEFLKLIIIKYMNKKFKEAPIVLVGKGITFDTGGISIKFSYSMDEIKYDMCGSDFCFRYFIYYLCYF
ncbi:hypothetical protein PADco_3270 [Candidatus Profftella armatura (Diaphorina cf. continua)]|uniref:Cytosol aminopeptidase domain-containing protein n=2 Tax=Candidatus Profftella armatura (Diaphorina cf. continua) TaxID=2661583 RepID=A0A7R6VYY9_9PROT|nr:hypothetical protein PADco_3270 [Candidatus Profftella armatura (Diaphorina cf. continua)]